LKICTDDWMNDTTTAPKFKNTSCEFRISPFRNRANLVITMINITQGSQLKFEIKGKVIDKKTSSCSVRIQENTKLKFITKTTRKQEGDCLAIYPSTYRIYISITVHLDLNIDLVLLIKIWSKVIHRGHYKQHNCMYITNSVWLSMFMRDNKKVQHPSRTLAPALAVLNFHNQFSRRVIKL
jgi:hypothetical protein